MKDYSGMNDGGINMLVGESLGLTSYILNQDESVQFRNEKGHIKGTKNYCNNPADAWPIIVDNRISIDFDGEYYGGKPSGWAKAYAAKMHGTYTVITGERLKNPLRAAMICYLMMKDAEKGHG